MSDVIIKLLIFIIGILVGTLFLDWYASVKRAIEEERIDVLRVCIKKQDETIKKQDDAIRKKQNRIDELEREAGVLIADAEKTRKEKER